MDKKAIGAAIKEGRTALGIELGSTRIKAVLTDEACQVLASDSYGWENELKDGIWTYELKDAWQGIQSCFAGIAAKVREEYDEELKKVGIIGVSAMMHGYLPFDKAGKQLAGFRTWRNNITGEAAEKLTEVFQFNIPLRWSIAHLYQAMLNEEEHVKDIDFLTTLAGYIHWQLSGKKVLGIGDASGMFPIDEASGSYDEGMLFAFEQRSESKRYDWKLKDILPKPLRAGEMAGTLTESGARLLDPTGTLASGSLMAPPEGDAGTGMVSTRSVRKRTGNISVGTSAFSMNVLEAPLKAVHKDIDIVTTPDGAPVAMVHTNNCSSDLNAWVELFGEFAAAIGHDLTPNQLYGALLGQARYADKYAGDLVNYNCLSGENITCVETGRPMFFRTPHSRMTLANFMLTQLYSAFAPLKIGMDILVKEEGVKTDVMIAQGGLFSTPVIGQQALADMLDMPITVMGTAGEGGPWGMAVLAIYAKCHEANETLADFLDNKVFGGDKGSTLEPGAERAEGCRRFIERYQAGLAAERAASAVDDSDLA
ncbi:MAG TPA: ATPase [Selenomonas sp.]|nr:ATPase [Selenomonadaceae bacterium]HCB92442.1 ATPase [Selenomonas sp.]